MLRAHQIVLSSSSPLLSSLLRSLSQSQPLLFFLGVSGQQLGAVLDFCYRGQVTLGKVHLEDFFGVAKLLGMKGMAGAGSEEEILDLHKEWSKPVEEVDFQIDLSVKINCEVTELKIQKQMLGTNE